MGIGRFHLRLIHYNHNVGKKGRVLVAKKMVNNFLFLQWIDLLIDFQLQSLVYIKDSQ